MIDPFWTPEGLAAAERYGISRQEAVDVVYSPTSVQVHIGDSTQLYLGAPIARVIVVTLERAFRNVTRYGITYVRPANLGEARAWEKRNP
jgi:hypothetical protein